MDIKEAILKRHSVRRYTDQKIQGDTLQQLNECIAACNRESGLHIQLCLEEPQAFDSMMARYGKFENVRNYIALVGKKSAQFEEKCGYYGERIVLLATQLGLQTCWVGMSYKKSKSTAVIERGEKLLLVIAIGYGQTSGVSHSTKPLSKISRVEGEMPDWFRHGMEAVKLAPTAVNQQKFMFELRDGQVSATAQKAFYSKVDLGIAKYHFDCVQPSPYFSYTAE
ncbi:MAG: nitroreductase family protein [Lachnospiraceae bacterium]